MKLSALLLLVVVALSGCANHGLVSSEKLKYTRWQLINKSNQVTQTPIIIQFVEMLQVRGFAGCNRFFAQAHLEDEVLLVSELGMTRKICTNEINQLENRVLQSLKSGVSVRFEKQLLIFDTSPKLVFKRVD